MRRPSGFWPDFSRRRRQPMNRGRLLTIGSFDGLHRGHKVLLDRVVLEAKKRGLKSLALTFRVPPRMVLNQSNPLSLLSDSFEKEFLLRKNKVDEVIFLPFGEKISRQRPFLFFRDELLNKYRAKGIVIGSDFRFGAGRSAGALELVRWGLDFEVPVWVISPVKWQNQVVSSSFIRHLLESGRYAPAERFLGHPYVISGRVAKGRGMGRKIGFPTANLKIKKGKILPPGVFVVKGRVASTQRQLLRGKNNLSFQGVCNIGVRPTMLKSGKLSVEVHMFNMSGNLNGKVVILELLHRLRPERRFASITKLVSAIRRDVRLAKKFLKSHPKESFADWGENDYNPQT